LGVKPSLDTKFEEYRSLKTLLMIGRKLFMFYVFKIEIGHERYTKL